MTRYGFIDTTGELVIPSPHGTPFAFNEGLARMPAGDGWAFVDMTGRQMPSPSPTGALLCCSPSERVLLGGLPDRAVTRQPRH